MAKEHKLKTIVISLVKIDYQYITLGVKGDYGEGFTSFQKIDMIRNDTLNISIIKHK